jgi:hypothetical protein
VVLEEEGQPPRVIARFPGHEIRDAALTRQHLAVAVYPRNPETMGVRSPGRLLSVPLAGGEPILLQGDFSILTHLAGHQDRVYVQYKHAVHRFDPSRMPEPKAPEVVAWRGRRRGRPGTGADAGAAPVPAASLDGDGLRQLADVALDGLRPARR